MRYFSLIIFLLIGELSLGQIKPDFFPEDVSLSNNEIKCYCNPGLRSQSRSKGLEVSYGMVQSGNYVSEGDPFSEPNSILKTFTFLKLKVKAPIINKPRTKLLLGYDNFSEFYNFRQIGVNYTETFNELNTQALKSNSFSGILSQSLNEKYYTIFRFKYSSNGNYSEWVNFNSQYAIYKITGVLGIKKSEDFEWGFGINYVKSFRRTTVLPFLLFNKNFSQKWGLESVFPVNVFLRHNFNPKTLTFLGAEYNSKSYLMEIENPHSQNLEYAFNHSEIIASFSVERHITSWLWINAKVGYQNNFSSDFEPKTSNAIPFHAEPKNGLFLHAGLFISPPDRVKE